VPEPQLPDFESDFEARLYAERLATIEKIVALGHPAYPNHYRTTHTIPEIHSAYDAATAEQLEADKPAVSIAGRLMAIRAQGKAGFAQLQQSGQRLQIYVRLDAVGESAFALYKLLDLGDHIGVTGHLFRTRTGELTIHVETITFLTKALLALPDKYHGLEDVELRYRQRYVDLFMNADVREVFVKRAQVLRSLRNFFDARGYIEVETPMMQPIAGGAAARPFETHHNALDLPLYLRIAPELYLKRLVVGGLDRVYEINRNFRNEGISTQHNPEFTMLEFYQAYSNYHDLMDLTEEIIKHVALEVNGTTKTTFNEVEIDLANWSKYTMVDSICELWHWRYGNPPTREILSNEASLLNFIESNIATLDPKKRPFSQLPTDEDRKKTHGGHVLMLIRDQIKKATSLGKQITLLFEGVIEENLIQPTIIYDFPLAVSPLSKIKPEEPDWVERFEFYIGGFEVGNAFSELNDPVDQHRRFLAQLAEKERGDEEAMQMDSDYVRALGYGLPPTAGEGIGIDRLTMILTGQKSIRDVILFPLLRPQKQEAPPTDPPKE